MKIYSKKTTFNTDVYTPVGIFLALRNHYSRIALLESNDYSDRSESKSFIGLNPIAEIIIYDNELILKVNDNVVQKQPIMTDFDVLKEVEKLLRSFKCQDEFSAYTGFFGSINFEFSFFIERKLNKGNSSLDLPDLQLCLFECVLVLDHFKNEGFVIESNFKNSFGSSKKVLDILLNKSQTPLYFEKRGEETSSISDEEYKELVTKAKKHCGRGDVFQLVLSRDFQQPYFGDDFEVYRSLRRLNPSPYLFYFDFETHRIIGSSPEAQIKLNQQKAEIHPIAGTVKKSGEEKEDLDAIEYLRADRKENAEHTMLVDLARNDLSKNCTHVQVEKLKEIQHFSHVIHLVSKVSGRLKEEVSGFKLFSDTFPAGTLSGTPKPMALKLISEYEKTTRDYYGGAIGFIALNGDMNFAIIIRSILSKNYVLNYRAGAGIVVHSEEESELREVNHKLGAVRKAIEFAMQGKTQQKPVTI